MTAPAADPTPRMLRLPKVVEMTGLHRATLYRLIAAGKFPKQCSLTGNRASGWRENEILEWIESRAMVVNKGPSCSSTLPVSGI